MDEQAITLQCCNLASIVPRFQLYMDQYCAEASSAVIYQQYGVGGTCIHRGYYCPSLIADIIVGNVSRGKLTKKLLVGAKPDYMFGFDTDGYLRVVRQADRCEYIIYQAESEIGIALSNHGDVETISECKYKEDELISYSWGLYDPLKGDISEFVKEEYTYLPNQLVVNWFRLFNSCEVRTYQHNKYSFELENGYLASYKIEQFSGKTKIASAWDGHVFKVAKKRRIQIPNLKS